MSDMRLIVAGAGGRMGRTLIHAIAAMDGATLAGAVEAAGSAVIGRDAGELAGLGKNGVSVTTEVEPLLAQADGLLDFTVPAATIALAELTARRGLVHVIGTTGLSGEDDELIAEAGRRAVIVQSGNMSLGVNLLAALVKRVAKTLDEDFDVEILEMHHNKKVDAPSGTALMLGRAAADGRGIDLDQRSERGRDGHTGARCRHARRLCRGRSDLGSVAPGAAARQLHDLLGRPDDVDRVGLEWQCMACRDDWAGPGAGGRWRGARH